MTIYKHIHCYTHLDTAIGATDFLGTQEANECITQYLNEPELTIILNHSWEKDIVNAINGIAKFINIIKDKKPQWKIFLIANTSDSIHETKLRGLKFTDILFIDFFLYRVYKEVIVHKKNAIVNRTQNNVFNKNKFLFLTGKAHKINRVGLLKKFIDNDLMKFAEWSFFYFEENIKYNLLVREQFPDLSDNEFRTFVNTWKRNPDNINIQETVTLMGYEYNGIPYDINLYQDTDFQVISETNFTDTTNPWITEKTWLPILNRHPFIMAGDVATLKLLNKMGFSTFDEFLTIDYDLIDNQDKRLDAIVANTEHWVHNLKLHHKMINLYVNHNFKVLEELYFINNQKISNFIEKYNLINLSVEELVPTAGRHDDHSTQKKQDKLFLTFYNNIKDPNWPICFSEQDFFKLPLPIQKECIKDFGYIPPHY